MKGPAAAGGGGAASRGGGAGGGRGGGGGVVRERGEGLFKPLNCGGLVIMR